MNISSSQNLSKLWGPDAAGAGVAAEAANSSLTKAQFESPALFVGLLAVSLITIFGNALVILAVLRERTLHSATNYFITSLAVSDMLVGAVVMPFSAFYEAMDKKWIFGEDWCDGWHSFDVLASTASILNLCVISLDRYWAIEEPMSYPAKMTDKKAAFLIVIVWLCSSAISFPAIAWWRATDIRPTPPLTCPFTEDIGYLVFSSIVSFYGPLVIMLFAYYRILRAAVGYEKSLRSGVKQLNTGCQNANGQEVTLRIHRGGGAKANILNPDLAKNGQMQISYKPGYHSGGKNTYLISAGTQGFNLSRKWAKFTKEKKAAKTLGAVMGIFIICWLPFFVTNIISGFCLDCLGSHIEVVFQVVTWLGWMNSCMNPCIYACCSKDFNRAFKRIIMCQKRGRASPIRHHHVPTTPTSDFPNRRKVIKLSLSNALTEFRKKGSDRKASRSSVGFRRASLGPVTACTLIVEEPKLQNNGQIQNGKLAANNSVKRNSMYAIPPPNYKYEPQGNFEILL